MKANITKEIITEFIINNEFELRSTHRKLCVQIINRMYKKMCAGIKFSSIRVEDNLICDGHHRYLASLLSQCQLERIPGKTTSATEIVSWDLVLFEDEWEEPEEINKFNKQDAVYNNINIDVIDNLLK